MINDLPNESKIFVPHKLNDFEKLLFAQRAIKDLQTENRILRLENDALKRTVKNFEELFTASAAEKRQYKADTFYRHIQNRLLEMSAKMRRYRHETERLKNENAVLRMQKF